MELVSGVSLHELVHTRLNFPLIWTIVDQILSALAHAHARGIIHGDLKPSNVLVEAIDEQPPQIHVLDFGPGLAATRRLDQRLDGNKPMEFAPHAGAGTPGYMAPEQIQHEMHHVCGATDLYSLGCILYRLFAGRAPFSGESKELLRVHAFEQPPALKAVIDVPEGTIAFVTRLLAKRPVGPLGICRRGSRGVGQVASQSGARRISAAGRSALLHRQNGGAHPPHRRARAQPRSFAGTGARARSGSAFVRAPWSAEKTCATPCVRCATT